MPPSSQSSAGTGGQGWIGPDALRGLLVPIADLHPDPANARRHGERNIEAIVASLSRFGQRFPIVVQKQGMVVRAGNGRMDAAKRMGWTHIAAVVVDESSVEATAFAIADNRTAELAEWDDETLASLLQSLPEADRLVAGFGDDELQEVLDRLTPGEVVEDEPPAPLPDPVSRTGDLWLLGEHRLLCGDSTKAEDVAGVLNGAVPFLCVTDPPYGVEYDPEWRSEAAKAGHLAYADRRVGVVRNDDRADWSDTWALFPGDVIYSWHPAGAPSLVHAAALQGSGFALRMQIIWAKSNFPIGRGDYHVRHEPCWYAVREGKAARRTDDRTQTTLWEINLDKNVEGGHSTQKPVECMARPIRNHSAPEVYEPFSGSGTTIIACEQLNRRCFAIEIEPRYVDVAVRRWEKLTGREAVLDGTNKTWKQVARDRGVSID